MLSLRVVKELGRRLSTRLSNMKMEVVIFDSRCPTSVLHFLKLMLIVYVFFYFYFGKGGAKAVRIRTKIILFHVSYHFKP